MKRIVTYAGVIVLATACEGPSGFSPPAESYSASQATVEGVRGQRTVARVDSTFFGRNRPMLGRDFGETEYGDDAPVAMLSHAFWTERFDGSPEVIGSKLVVDGEERTVVGVMPRGVDVPPAVALWLPGFVR